MSEAIEQSVIRQSPPASYGDVLSEYEAVRGGGAGLIDLSSRGLVEVGGAEAVQFLNGLITNDVKTLEAGAWMLAAFPNAQGRLIAFARVLRLGDSFLFDTEAATRAAVFKTLERFTLAGDFRVTDRSDELRLISVQGARAAACVSSVLGEEAARVERGRIHTAQWNEQQVQVIRATHTSEDGFDLVPGAEQATGLWDALRSAGAQPVGLEALEILRIEAGLPRYGLDMDDTNVVTETGLDEAVSYTKGCYIGQEIIARIHWRGHVAKRISGLSLETEDEVLRGASIKSKEGREIGRVTSTTRSPRLKRTVALCYVKYDYLTPGTEVNVMRDGQEIPARISELPLVRGSWYEEQRV